jgi:Na+/proline symporter
VVLWVVLVGGIGQNLVPYISDQGVVQRYMSVSSQRKAAQSIWTNAGLSFFATILFFGMGTALYVFYKQNPTSLDPTYQNDAVFPLFIAQQLPVGVAGIVIAGLFAAAQSTISTSMNSIATAFTTDFVERLQKGNKKQNHLNLARVLTVVFGAVGTLSALVIANSDIKSLWDIFLGILGLLGGAMCGLFILGIFTQRASGYGAFTGAIMGTLSLWIVQNYTDINFLLYAFIGISSTFGFGYLASLILPGSRTDLKGLTLHDNKVQAES